MEILEQLKLVYRDTGGQIEIKDLEIEFTWEQLRKFAIRIADEHLKYYDQVGK